MVCGRHPGSKKLTGVYPEGGVSQKKTNTLSCKHLYCNVSGMKPWLSGYLFASLPHFSSKSAFYLFGHLAHHQTTKCLGSAFASRVAAHDQGPQQSACHILFAS